MNILDKYINLREDTETPLHLYRWAFLSCVGAAMSRNVWLMHGDKCIYPNMYVLFVGSPASKKSTAIKGTRKLLEGGGFTNFSFGNTSMQQFFLDMQDINLPKKLNGEINFEDALNMKPEDYSATNAFVAEDEMINFLGQNNRDFIAKLTDIWDNKAFEDFRFKNSKCVHIDRPTVSILGGFTPASFVESVPTEAAGNGFLSRCVLVYAKPSGKKITWPAKLPEQDKEFFREVFCKLQNLHGQAPLTPAIMDAFDKIYHGWEPLDDVRLQYYSGRRLEHLFKLTLCLAALRSVEHDEVSPSISLQDVEQANTILTYTEEYMSMAMGELGKSRNSDAAQKIVEKLAQANEPVSLPELWMSVSQDLEKFSQLHDIINKLKHANKITISTRTGEGGIPESKIMLKPQSRRGKGVFLDFNKYIPEAQVASKVKIV